MQLSKTCTFPDCVGGESEIGPSLSQASSVTSQRDSQVINLWLSISTLYSCSVLAALLNLIELHGSNNAVGYTAAHTCARTDLP